MRHNDNLLFFEPSYVQRRDILRRLIRVKRSTVKILIIVTDPNKDHDRQTDASHWKTYQFVFMGLLKGQLTIPSELFSTIKRLQLTETLPLITPDSKTTKYKMCVPFIHASSFISVWIFDGFIFRRLMNSLSRRLWRKST